MRTTKETNVKIPKTNSGITLIALVITIIVMLILVAVTITMAVNGGLFEYASSAGTKTNGVIANEQELANLEEGLTVNDLIDKYTQVQGGTQGGEQGGSQDEGEGGETGSNTVSFTINGDSYIVASGTTWENWISTNPSLPVGKLGIFNGRVYAYIDHESGCELSDKQYVNKWYEEDLDYTLDALANDIIQQGDKFDCDVSWFEDHVCSDGNRD